MASRAALRIILAGMAKEPDVEGSKAGAASDGSGLSDGCRGPATAEMTTKARQHAMHGKGRRGSH